MINRQPQFSLRAAFVTVTCAAVLIGFLNLLGVEIHQMLIGLPAIVSTTVFIIVIAEISRRGVRR